MTKREREFKGGVIDTAEKREQAKSSFGYLSLPKGIRTFSIKEGTRKIKIDILPYEVTDSKHPDNIINSNVANKGDLWYKRPIKVHRNIGADNESIICPKSIGKPCPVCEHQKKRFNEGADKEETRELYARPRNLYVIIPVDIYEDHMPEEICVWDMSQSLFEDVLIEELRDDPENEIFPSLENGKTLELTLKWETLGKNTYPKVRKIDFIDRKPYDENTLDDVPDLDEMLKILPYKEIENKFFELNLEDQGGTLSEVNEESEEPRRRKVFAETEKNEEFEEPASHRRRTKIDKKDDKPKEDIPVERPRRRRPEPEEKVEEDKTKKCPYKHNFGIDNDRFDECYECNSFDDCYDANRAIKK